MADIKTQQAAPVPTEPTEGDGVSYRGIVWFVVILVATTAFCQLLVWGMYELSASRVAGDEPPRAPLAVPAAAPGQVPALPPGPNLLIDEPQNLRAFRTNEDTVLTSYGWVDQNAGIVRIPIDRAKELVLERGLLTVAPAQGSSPAVTTPPPAGPPDAKGKQVGK
jgi:hypothetical protein